MKIAIITYALRIGGVETFIRLLAKYCFAEGHEVDLVEVWAKGEWSDRIEKDGTKVRRLLQSPFESAVSHSGKISDLMKSYDAVLLNDVPSAQASIGLLPDQTVVIPILHNCDVPQMMETALANSNNWDAVVAVSPAVQRAAMQRGIRPDDIYCIPNGVNVPSKWPKLGKSHDQLRVIFLGAISDGQKGVFYLPEILTRVLAQRKDVVFSVIGDGPDLPELKKRCADLGDFHIEFLGSVPYSEVPLLLDQGDILLMPSRFEGMPLVLLEAMAMGLVPVASLLPGCTDVVVKDGLNGRLISVGNTSGFAEAITMLAADRSQLAWMSQKAWSTISNGFSYETVGKAYMKLIESCKSRNASVRVPHRIPVIETRLLGDYPQLAKMFVRPVRKLAQEFNRLRSGA
jgi:glycosyltransferase involved in cell wall biosynthesis